MDVCHYTLTAVGTVSFPYYINYIHCIRKVNSVTGRNETELPEKRRHVVRHFLFDMSFPVSYLFENVCQFIFGIYG